MKKNVFLIALVMAMGGQTAYSQPPVNDIRGATIEGTNVMLSGITERWIRVIYLKRNKDVNKIVAILGVRHRTFKPEFNPNLYFKYGSIPPLPKLTQLDCVRLWGTDEEQNLSTSSPDCQRNFHLITGNGEEFKIETKFKNNKLHQYRVIPKNRIACKISEEWIDPTIGLTEQ